MDDRRLAGKVALVAGATRGTGRGIALELGAAGARVYCTGRSTRSDPDRSAEAARTSPFDLSRRPETIEATVEAIEALGGEAIGVRVDHESQAEVAALVERIRDEAGRLDILVNDIWGGEAFTEWGKPFWELDLDKGRAMLQRGLGTHVMTSRHAVPLMLATGPGGLVVEVTDGGGMHYRRSLFYDLVKSTAVRLAFAMAEELRAHGLAAVAVSPGFLRSEAMLDFFGVTEENWRDGIAEDPHFRWSETPRFVGRGIAALAADPERMAWSGRALASWHLGKIYGLVDLDGTTPDWGAHAAEEDFGAEERASDRRFRGMYPGEDEIEGRDPGG